MAVLDGSAGLAGEDIGLEKEKEKKKRERRKNKISLRGNENMEF